MRTIDGHKIDDLSRSQEDELRELLAHSGDDGVEAINEMDSDTVDQLLDMSPSCSRGPVSGFGLGGGGSCIDEDTLDDFRESLSEELADSSNVDSDDIERYVDDMSEIKEHADDGEIENANDLFDDLEANPTEDELVGAQLEADRAVYYTKQSDVTKVIVEPGTGSNNRIDFEVKKDGGYSEFVEAKNAMHQLSRDKIRRELGDVSEKFRKADKNNEIDIDAEDKRVVTFGGKRRGISSDLGDSRDEIRESLSEMLQLFFKKEKLEIDEIRIVTPDGTTYKFTVDSLFE